MEVDYNFFLLDLIQKSKLPNNINLYKIYRLIDLT